MPQFDVYALIDGGIVVDCQADHFANIATRFVAPLEPIADGPDQQPRLNPVFTVNGQQMTLLTQFATAVRKAELGTAIGSLEHARLDIISAFDKLLTGN